MLQRKCVILGIGPKNPHTSAEIFRDMHSLAPQLAQAGSDIVRPILGREPSTQEFLQASQKGDKKKLETVFADAQSICATVKSSLDKYRIVLASPISDEIARFCNTNVGIEMFTIHMVYWILPSPKTAKSRCAPKFDLAFVSRKDFFEKKGFAPKCHQMMIKNGRFP